MITEELVEATYNGITINISTRDTRPDTYWIVASDITGFGIGWTYGYPPDEDIMYSIDIIRMACEKFAVNYALLEIEQTMQTGGGLLVH